MCMWILYLCDQLCHCIHSLRSQYSPVFGQAGLTIDWNWTFQARGVSSYACMLFCEGVCVCVCDICLKYVFVYFCVFITFLHVIKWGSIAQVSTSWTSLAKGARSYTRGGS